MRSALLLAAAATFGMTMRVVAGLADSDDGAGILVDVVNWAALWVVMPVLAGRWSPTATAAALLGAACGIAEVVVYYAGDLAESPFKVFWLSGGAVACAALGVLSHRIRSYRWSAFLAPSLFVVEPAAVLIVFHALGRHMWSSWTTSAALEMVLGLGAAAVVIGTREVRHRSRKAVVEPQAAT